MKKSQYEFFQVSPMIVTSDKQPVLISRHDLTTINFWLCFAGVLLGVILFNARPVPSSNEYVYLLRLIPDFLPNDWTFSQAANEHWLFNLLFSFPARYISLEVVGWLGRVLVWTGCTIALIKLGRQFEISYFYIAVSIILWLAFPQGDLNVEWIFGGFEAKTAAYTCLLFSLYLFSIRKVIFPSILLGLCFSFHPAVGLWAILAIGCVLLLEKLPVKKLVTWAGLTGIFALPGVIPLVSEFSANSTLLDWQYMVLTVLPFHLDPFSFDKQDVLLLFVMLLFNTVALWNSPLPAVRFCTKFQVLLGVFFLFGIVLSLLEMYSSLRFMPMRLFPVFTRLFFVFSVFHFIPKVELCSNRVKLTVVAVAVIVLHNPLANSILISRDTLRSWTTPRSDLQQTYQWLSENTGKEALILAPPESKDVWYISKRAVVASYKYPSYNRISEWRERVADLTGNAQLAKGEEAYADVAAAFNQLSSEQIERLLEKYRPNYLISKGTYSYALVFQSGTYKVYKLPNRN